MSHILQTGMPGLSMFTLILVFIVGFICYARISKVERYVVSVQEQLETALDEHEDKYVCFDLLEETSNVILRKANAHAVQHSRALAHALHARMGSRSEDVEFSEGGEMFAQHDVKEDNFPEEDVEDIEYCSNGDIVIQDTEAMLVDDIGYHSSGDIIVQDTGAMLEEEEVDFADTAPSFKNLIQHVKNKHRSRLNESVDPYKVEGVAEVISSVANIFGQMGSTHEVHVHAADLTAAQMFVAAPPTFISSPGAASAAVLTQNMTHAPSQQLHPAAQKSSARIYDLGEDDFDVDPSAHIEDPRDDSI